MPLVGIRIRAIAIAVELLRERRCVLCSARPRNCSEIQIEEVADQRVALVIDRMAQAYTPPENRATADGISLKSVTA